MKNIKLRIVYLILGAALLLFALFMLAVNVVIPAHFVSEAEKALRNEAQYELIDAMAESQDYIIFLMKKRYAQPLDKRTLTGGTVEEFKRFLEKKTGKDFRHVK